MTEERRINPQHDAVRPVLRVLGPVLAVMGLVLMVAGMASFFLSFGSFGFGSFEPPRYFWCVFVGMPLLFVGLVLCKLGYLGAISRYVAGETAPVSKDTFNYMAEGTQSSVKTLASAAAEGISSGWHRGETAAACPRCAHPNDADANFCEQCGASLSQTCPVCQKPNDAAAKFCDHCGQPFGVQ